MAENLKKQLPKLSKRGPNRVLVGDLEFAGLPGKIYAPAEGGGLPALAFGHEWITDISRYHNTLKHLASWGFVVAAPNTEQGLSPNHRGLATDLESAIQIAAGVKLGNGKITVSPGKLGFVGHGMGGSCAVLAAAGRSNTRAVVAIYPAVTSPSAESAAKNVEAPGLILDAGKESVFRSGNPLALARSWKGPVAYRKVTRASSNGFSESIMLKTIMGLGWPEFSAQETARGLMTGFLLHRVAGDKKYAAFSAPEVIAKHVENFSDEKPENPIASLLT
ncbi:MAG: dienelactone hydrolase family protein [Corynebacterium sp.]|nr:dienelactone hydrolase family protein [Corynebacterium sp.]